MAVAPLAVVAMYAGTIPQRASDQRRRSVLAEFGMTSEDATVTVG